MRKSEIQTALAVVIPEMLQGFSIKVNLCEMNLDPERESVKRFISELQKELTQEIKNAIPAHTYF